MYRWDIDGRTYQAPSGLHEVTLGRLLEWKKFHSHQPSLPLTLRTSRAKGLFGFFKPRTSEVISDTSYIHANNARMRAEVCFWLHIPKSLSSTLPQESVNQIHAFLSQALTAVPGTVYTGTFPWASKIHTIHPDTLTSFIARPDKPIQSLLHHVTRFEGQPIPMIGFDGMPVSTVAGIFAALTRHNWRAMNLEEPRKATTLFNSHFTSGTIMPHLTVHSYHG